MTRDPMSEFRPPERLLLGPGPCMVHPRVLQAMTAPLLGYLDPDFFALMEDIQALLRRVFQTENRLTFPVSGTGTAGMEMALVNLLESGDAIVVGVNGFFGERMSEIASRCGATVVQAPGEWGRIVEPEAVAKALRQQKRTKVVAIVHGETSTGVLQPLDDIARLAREHGALLLVDAVTSLGGAPVAIDKTGVDVCYSGTQKCLGCPPGLSPITFSERAVEAVKRRGRKVQSWYLDVTLIENYWVQGRVYHHTPPVSMLYGFREALRLALEEGLDARIKRHRRNAAGLRAGLEALGLKLLVAKPEHRLDPLTAVLAPDGIDDMALRKALLQEFNIEIGGGLGPLRGKLWRIGLMGHSSQPANVLWLLHALERLLPRYGVEAAPGAALSAAEAAWGKMG